VFGLCIGTLIVFGLVTAVTAEETTQTYQNECPPGSEQYGCVSGPQTYTSTQVRTDRTWFLLAPNPFVVLADAAPQLPEGPFSRQPDEYLRGVSARDLDPLGQIGSQVRDLRRPPQGDPYAQPGLVVDGASPLPLETAPRPAPVWPTGLAVNVVLAVAALLLTSRRLRTPTRNLPKGQRVA
jgi:hypothetical protein